MKSYHFSLGNSDQGPIGFCAVVRAKSKKDALQKLKKQLPESCEVIQPHIGEVDYIAVYFNAENITTKDIDEVS